MHADGRPHDAGGAGRQVLEPMGLGAVLPPAREGKVVVVAITDDNPSALTPGITPQANQGLPGYRIGFSFAPRLRDLA